MLYPVPDLTTIDDVPNAHDYRRWRAALDRTDPSTYTRIHELLDPRFNAREVDTSGWIPGADWTGTEFEPISSACGENPEVAALFFGLLIWQIVTDRNDCWSFGRYEKEGIPIRSMTYFRIDCPRE
ncbi:MAG: hypothetical protein EPN47_15940 [Acidobacteria bacterium]|nr:MAG: hypothetical protein EPN47_15940 [Acidobacteriota bacterium]